MPHPISGICAGKNVRWATAERADPMNNYLALELSELIDLLRAEAADTKVAISRIDPRNRRETKRYASMLARTSQRLQMLEELRSTTRLRAPNDTQ